MKLLMPFCKRFKERVLEVYLQMKLCTVWRRSCFKYSRAWFFRDGNKASRTTLDNLILLENRAAADLWLTARSPGISNCGSLTLQSLNSGETHGIGANRGEFKELA